MSNVNLPKAPPVYSQIEEQQFRGRVEVVQSATFGSGADIRLKATRLTLTSPNGTEYALTVDNAGALATEPYP